MKRNIRRQFHMWALTGVAAATVAVTLQPATAQSNSSMQVFARAMQIFQWVAQNGHLVDTPDGKAAPCRDPWVSSAFRLVFQREPNASGDTGECNYRNFGGGSWSSYRDLVYKTAWYRAYKEMGLVRGGTAISASMSTPAGIEPLVKTAVAEITGTKAAKPQAGQDYALVKERVYDVYYACSNNDVSRAIIETTGRAPRGVENQGECNTLLYGDGRWSNYSDLKAKVRTTLVAKPHAVGVCRNSELTRVITDVKRQQGNLKALPSGRGELGECNSALYGGGQWSSYNDLKSKVAARFQELKLANIQLLPDNSIRAQKLERGGGQGALMAVLAAANAYMQWKVMQPPKQPKNQMQFDPNAMMQGGMQPGMAQPGMQQPGMQPPMMQQPMMQQQAMMPSMIQPGAQMPMMPPMQQPMMMQQQPMMMQPQGMQPGMMPQGASQPPMLPGMYQ